jgi:hypothetical protein
MEWRVDRGVQQMGHVARGLYRELLDEQWLAGYIPDDIAKLAEIAGCPEKVMKSQWPKIARRFEEIAKGQLVDRKLESIRSESDAYRAEQARHGSKGGRARKTTSAGSPNPETTTRTESPETATLAGPSGSESRAQGSAEGTLDEPRGYESQNRQISQIQKKEEYGLGKSWRSHTTRTVYGSKTSGNAAAAAEAIAGMDR